MSEKNIREINFPPLSRDAHDREAVKKSYYRQNGEIAVKNLKRNNFDAYYYDTAGDAKKQILSLIKDESIVAFGDSHTIFALELDRDLAAKKCVTIPYPCAVNARAFNEKIEGFNILGDEETTKEILKSYMTANVFMLGANAITLKGEIVNIDGAGNRIAGSIFGADRIVIVAGANKIVQDLPAAMSRIRDVAAQMNNLKYDNILPCNLTGFCNECNTPERNCNVTAIYHKKPVAADFHVVIIGEELGF